MSLAHRRADKMTATKPTMARSATNGPCTIHAASAIRPILMISATNGNCTIHTMMAIMPTRASSVSNRPVNMLPPRNDVPCSRENTSLAPMVQQLRQLGDIRTAQHSLIKPGDQEEADHGGCSVCC